jgi:UDP-N-acetylmuramate--alanine ligase
VQNACAAIAVALEMGCPADAIRNGFARFGGVRRRFSHVGTIAPDVRVIDDYAHHPVEIRAVLSAARDAASGRVLAVVQPHRFTRLRDLLEDFQGAFGDADLVYATPVYAAGEDPIPGIDENALVEGLKARGHRHAKTVQGPEDLARQLAAEVQPGDMVVCLGAGDITRWAAGLADAVMQASEGAGA